MSDDLDPRELREWYGTGSHAEIIEHDGLGLIAVMICPLCGQPGAAGRRCHSSVHSPPRADPDGDPSFVPSTTVVSNLRNGHDGGVAAHIESQIERLASDAHPFAVGLCPDPGHVSEFYMPLTEYDVAEGLNRKCPLSGCDRDLVIYRR